MGQIHKKSSSKIYKIKILAIFNNYQCTYDCCQIIIFLLIVVNMAPEKTL
jgi:hypothetical protein